MMLCCGPPYITNCNKFIEFNESKYNEIPTNQYTINNVVLNDNCLQITITHSGCDKNDWDMNFIASEIVAETLPPQYHAKIELITNKTLPGNISKIMSFDLTPLKQSGKIPFNLKLNGWEDVIIY